MMPVVEAYLATRRAAGFDLSNAEHLLGSFVRFAAKRNETHIRAESAIDWAALGVRRGKAALSSGCKSHPATAPAGSNRSSHGGNEVAEASG